MKNELQELLNLVMEQDPEAAAMIKGSPQFSALQGTVLFYPFWNGSMLFVSLTGLPHSDSPCSDRMFALHIHSGSQCSGTLSEPFSNADGHYNPLNCPHPAHAGDLPVLISNHGTVFQVLYTDRFIPQDVIGRTAIVHLLPDDFRTQPSGNSGMMIACGEIKKYHFA